MSTLRKALDEIYIILCEVDSYFTTIFNPGLIRTEIEEFMHGFELYPNEEICELYQWSNGTQSEETFFPSYSFNSLAENLDMYEMLREVDGYTNQFWKSGWFPICNCDDSYYFIDCGNSFTQLSNVYFYRTDIGIDATVAFPSLTSMMQGIAECHREGIYLVERLDIPDFPYSLVTCNEVDEARIFAKYSPESSC